MIEPSLPRVSRDLRALTFTILMLLVIDLFIYRGVPAFRSIAFGTINLDWLAAFGVTGWWKPAAQATSYLLTVWHATMLGILLSGLAVTILPLYLNPYFTRTGFRGSLLGTLFALPQPFCSCCSSIIAPSFARRGASTNFLLSFVIGAPMLNVTTIILALALLPPPFAMTRVFAGIVMTVFVTSLVARVADRWGHTPLATQNPGPDWLSCRSIRGAYLRLFDLDRIVGGRTVDTPSELVRVWLSTSGRIALRLVPMLWAGSVIASALFHVLPSAFGNNLLSVVLAAIGGTFFMISTWSEIPIALQLIHAGFNGPAAALLVVLPAISLPCMMLLIGSFRHVRLVALLSAGVVTVGIVAGTLFL